jgi:hypothetical protein
MAHSRLRRSWKGRLFDDTHTVDAALKSTGRNVLPINGIGAAGFGDAISRVATFGTWSTSELRNAEAPRLR